MNRPYELPPWLAYAGFGVLNLAALSGLLFVIGPAGVAWLLTVLACVGVTRSYVAYRASLPEEEPTTATVPETAGAAESAGARGPRLRLLVRPMLAEGTFVVVESAEVYEPVRTAGS